MTLRRVDVMAGDCVWPLAGDCVWPLWVEVDEAQAAAMASMVESGCVLRLYPSQGSGTIWDTTRSIDYRGSLDQSDLTELIDELCSQWDSDRHAEWGRRFDDTV